MTHEDLLALADRVIAGPMDEESTAYEGRFPRGVATKLEAALRKHAVASLFQPVPANDKAKRDAARAANAAVVQKLLA